MPQDQARDCPRRDFIVATGAVAAGGSITTMTSGATRADEPDRPAGAIDEATIEQAERLAGVRYTGEERRQMLEDIEQQLARLEARRSMGLPGVDEAPATIFDPRLPGADFGYARGPFAPPQVERRRPPVNDDELAFASLAELGSWVRERRISSGHLTRVYLDRLERIGPELECTVTVMREAAMARARAMDIEIASGRYRGPLHGIPWGAKDLFDTAGVRTTWGATPYRDRVPTSDAAVVERLDEAGAVLVAKLTLGALAYGDIWFGGKTRNPWNREQGSSGSSAGSAAATVAGLVGFALGTETYGSIVSPCMRCGATGLRPTFGRVSRRGAMPLCWTLDKVGPICRRVEDTMLVLDAINGQDDGDAASIEMPLAWDAARGGRGLRVGYAPAWFEGEEASDQDRAALAAARACGFELVEIDLPEWPYDALLNIIFVESAAVFEDLTRSDRDDELVWQVPAAWPNSFRQAWFIPAVEHVQVDRFRRKVMTMMAERFATVDAMIGPSYAANLLMITNATGHPSLTLRSGFKDDGTPTGVTLWGRLFDEGTLCNAGMALEEELGAWERRPEE